MAVRPKLLAVPPGDVEPKRPKVLIYGGPGVRKTWISCDFPSPYFIDTEGGADLKAYRKKIEAGGGAYMGQEQGSLDFDTVISQLQALAQVEHGYRTVIIDSVSKLWNAALTDEQERLGSKDAFGAYKKAPTRQFMTMVKWLNRLDMTAVLIAQQKELWGLNDQKQREMIGYTYDCQDKLEYELHLTLRIARIGDSSYAYVGKSRLPSFKTGDSFDWTYPNFAERYGRDVIERTAEPLALASQEQIDELNSLLEVVKMPDDWQTKIFKAAGVDDWPEMDGQKVTACITMLKNRISA